MAFTPRTVAGTVATIVDRLAADLDDVYAAVITVPAGGPTRVTGDTRAAILEVLGRALQDMIAAETNSTIKTKMQAIATQLGVL